MIVLDKFGGQQNILEEKTPFDKSASVQFNSRGKGGLQSSSKNFGDDFIDDITTSYRSVVSHALSIMGFWDQ